MKSQRRVTSRRSAWLLAAACLLQPWTAHAQSDQLITLVVPFAPGGGLDLTARTVLPAIAKILGQNAIVKNVAGAGGTIGAAQVARAAPDGLNVLLASAGPMTVQPHVMKGIKYSPADFIPVCQITSGDVVMMTTKESGLRTVQDVVAKARSIPGGLPYGTSGVASMPHVTMLAFARAAGVNLLHVPFRGAGDVVVGLRQNSVALVNELPLVARVHHLQPIAVMGAQRLSDMPDVPTMKEAGLDLNYAIWQGLFLPRGTPDAVVDRLETACEAALRTPAVIENLTALNSPVVFRDRRSFRALVTSESEKYRALVAETGLRLEE